jgi:hypothetical protein
MRKKEKISFLALKNDVLSFLPFLFELFYLALKRISFSFLAHGIIVLYIYLHMTTSQCPFFEKNIVDCCIVAFQRPG